MINLGRRRAYLVFFTPNAWSESGVPVDPGLRNHNLDTRNYGMKNFTLGVQGFCMVHWGGCSHILSDNLLLPPGGHKICSTAKGTLLLTGTRKPQPMIVRGWHENTTVLRHIICVGVKYGKGGVGVISWLPRHQPIFTVRTGQVVFTCLMISYQGLQWNWNLKLLIKSNMRSFYSLQFFHHGGCICTPIHENIIPNNLCNACNQVAGSGDN